GLGHNPWWAVVALLGAVTLYGASFPYTRRHLIPLQLEPVSLAAAQVLVATAVLLPFFLADGLNGHAITLRGATGVAALGVFGSGFAYMWNFLIIREVGSSVASTVTYLTPVVAVIVGVALLHEPLAWNEPVGGAAVLLGAAVGQGRLAWRPGYTLRRLREAESK
ncbi:MAG TPA: DMT family transporter, partial [Acidimicrobiales bacterium]|nr:DMT family transporter [Acidimicrobiales bacterium]